MTTLLEPTTAAGPVTGRRVLRSEWTKFRSLRSSWWSLAAAAVMTVGLGVAITLAAGGDLTSSAAPTEVATRSQLGSILAQLVLGTLAVLVISGEYGTGMIRSSLGVVPRRLPVLWAKLAVYTAVVLPVTAVTSVATFLLAQAAWTGQGRPGVSLTDPTVLRIVLGAPLYLTVAGLCAIAIGTLLRGTAGGITTMAGLFFVVPTVASALPSRIADAARFLPSNAGGALARLATSPRSMAPWNGFALLCCYAAVLVAVAAWRLRRTDV